MTATETESGTDADSTGGDESDGDFGPRPPKVGGAAWLALGLMVLLGSTTAMAAKLAVRDLPLSVLPIARYGLAALCLLPLALRNRRLVELLRRDGGRLLLAGLLCVPINQAFFLAGARLAPTTHVGLIYATCPLIVLLLAWAWRQERPDRRRIAGVFASVAGVAVLAIGGLGAAGRPAASVAAELRGDLLLLGAVTTWGAYLTLSKPLATRYGALPTLAGTYLLGCLLDLPRALAVAPPWADLAAVPAPAWWALLYLAVIVSVIGQFSQNFALSRLDASHVAVVGNVAPALTVLWGVLLLGEPFTPALAVGGLLTLAGIGLARRRPVDVPTRPLAVPRVETALVVATEG